MIACLALGFAAAALAHAAAARSDLESQLKTVGRVRLEGRRQVPARSIYRALKTKKPSIWPWADKAPLRYDFLRADTAAIEAVYRSYGYLDASVGDSVLPMRNPREVEVRFRIHEGPRSRIATLDFVNVTVVPLDILRDKVYAKPGEPFNPAFLIVDTSIVSREYQERGHVPHVVGRAVRDSVDSLRIHVAYTVDEGPRYTLGAVYLSSPDGLDVRESLVRRELKLPPGSVYKLSQVELSQERLYETGLFSQVQITNIPDSTNTQMEFYLQVRERRPRWLDAGIGSGTEERFRVTSEWGHRNLLGHGLEGVIGARLSLDGQGRFLLSRGEASLLEPWLFGYRNRAQATVYIERHDFRTDSVLISKNARGVSLQLRRDFGRNTRLRLTQDNTFVDQEAEFLTPFSDSARAALLADFVPTYSTHRLSLGGDRDRRDDPLLATRGSFQTASAELAGGPFRGSTSFTKYQAISSWYTPMPWPRWVLATRLRGGIIQPFGTRRDFVPTAGVDPEVARVPTEDVFRLGGVNSVRGYDENEIAPAGGLAVILANAELRIPLVGPFGLETYLDAGNAWARPGYVRAENFTPRFGEKHLSPSDVRYVYGVGGRFELPFGPLRLDYSWATAGRHRFGRAQFAIGPSF